MKIHAWIGPPDFELFSEALGRVKAGGTDKHMLTLTTDARGLSKEEFMLVLLAAIQPKVPLAIMED